MRLFIIPLIAMVVTQGIKLTLELARGKFSWRNMNGYGGMPSSHSAMATSLCYTIGYFEGFANPAFAISLILLVIILRDATGFRYQLGLHGGLLNKLVKELPDRQEYKFPIVNDRLGHTVAEVIVGVLTGVILTIILIPFFV
jgi:uncharacterized protein